MVNSLSWSKIYKAIENGDDGVITLYWSETKKVIW